MKEYDHVIDFLTKEGRQPVWLFFKVKELKTHYTRTDVRRSIEYDIVAYQDAEGLHDGQPPYELEEDDHEISQYLIRAEVGESYRD